MAESGEFNRDGQGIRGMGDSEAEPQSSSSCKSYSAASEFLRNQVSPLFVAHQTNWKALNFHSYYLLLVQKDVEATGAPKG